MAGIINTVYDVASLENALAQEVKSVVNDVPTPETIKNFVQNQQVPVIPQVPAAQSSSFSNPAPDSPRVYSPINIPDLSNSPKPAREDQFSENDLEGVLHGDKIVPHKPPIEETLAAYTLEELQSHIDKKRNAIRTAENKSGPLPVAKAKNNCC